MATGFLNIHKPLGVTSREAVDRAGRRLRKIKLGHCGTLDPLADGVLVVAVGRACRLVEQIQDLPKSYRATFRLGATSATELTDAEGPISETLDCAPPSPAAVETALAEFVGATLQTPPQISAVRLAGKYAYALTRRGKNPELTARPVFIQAIEAIRFDWPELEVKVDCGKGTYLRALARDLGAKLGCGGYVAALTRTRIGPFRLQDAVPLAATREEMLAKVVAIPTALAHLRKLELNADQLKRLQHGVPLPLTPAIEAAGSPLLFVTQHGLLILAKIDLERRCLKAERVIAETGPPANANR